MTQRHGRDADSRFDGSVPELYDRFMVPLVFKPYAAALVERVGRVAASSPSIHVLEVAAGTGVVTRQLAAELPSTVAITSTDLNQPMLDHAASVGTARPVTWRCADAMNLPFDDASFDVVVCQFGAMFFPDRIGAYAEMGRVLRPGGTVLFNTWDSIEHNEFPHVVEEALAALFPDDPPRFMSRTPHGYCDEATIRSEVAAAGFVGDVIIDVQEERSHAATAELAARAFCQGTPLSVEIAARDPNGLTHAIERSTARLTARFGATDLDGKIRGFVVTATK